MLSGCANAVAFETRFWVHRIAPDQAGINRFRSSDLSAERRPASGPDRVNVRAGQHQRAAVLAAPDTEDVADAVDAHRQAERPHARLDIVPSRLVVGAEGQTADPARGEGANAGQLVEMMLEAAGIDTQAGWHTRTPLAQHTIGAAREERGAKTVVNGIQEVTGSIPVRSTRFPPRG
jgi:hypothetical protein